MSLSEEILGWEALSQVWFVLNYVQLKFHDDNEIAVYNSFSLRHVGEEYRQNEFGYADVLVRAIGSKVVAASYQQKDHFAITFENGTVFTIHMCLGSYEIGEAFEYTSSRGPCIEFNT